MAKKRTEVTADAISELENKSIEFTQHQEQAENLLNEKLNNFRHLCTVTTTTTKPTLHQGQGQQTASLKECLRSTG